MKRSITLLVIVLVAAMAVATQAQDRKSLRINEVMIVNDTSIVDDYGEHHAWIELFNANFAPLEISSMYLTNDKNNPTKYPIPLGDVKTRISKRQHVVFWADNNPNKGTFHTSFTLVQGQDNWIGLYDSDRKTLVDSGTIPVFWPDIRMPAAKMVQAYGKYVTVAPMTISRLRAPTSSKTRIPKSKCSPKKMASAS